MKPSSFGFLSSSLFWLPLACPVLAAEGVEPSGLIRLSDTLPSFTNVGSVVTQGDVVLNADDARAIFGVTGAGVKLGVISDSFNGSGSTPSLASQITAGDLPTVTVVKDDSGTDEGRAMLEIVHDVAPGAQLFFHSAFNNSSSVYPSSHLTNAPDQTIADAIDALAAVPNMRIIVDDVGMLNTSRFQDGAAAQSANAAAAAGIGYFSAAGNSATNSTRVTTAALPGGTVNWGTDNLLQMSVGGLASARLVLQWGESYSSVTGVAGVTSDFSVSVTSPDGSTSYFSVDDQAAGQDPYEFITLSNSGASAASYAVQVTRLSGAAPVVMQLTAYNTAITDVDNTNSGTVVGQAAASGAVAVAATRWNTPTVVESFSSRGPTLILFDGSGNPINETRQTPLLTAPDGVSTTTAGFSSFYGTSAAAPHAAAVAALVLERLDTKGLSVTTPQLYRILYDSAVDLGTPGFDNVSGNGRLDALAAVSAGTVWDANGATAGLASGNGNWSTASWTLEAAGDKPTGRFIRGEAATFDAAGSYSVAVDGSYDVDGLKFNGGAVTLSNGGGALVLTSPQVQVAPGLSARIDAVLGGAAGLTKTGTGVLVLGGSTTHSYTGNTLVQAGELKVNAVLANSSLVTIDAGATLSGAGLIDGNTTISGTLSPGNSPGILTFGANVTWLPGGNYNWQIVDALGSAGTAWDLSVIDGDLDLSALSALNRFNINLWTLASTGPDVSGVLAGFDATDNFSWTIASLGSGSSFIGFSPDRFTINTSAINGTGGFSNFSPAEGRFSMAVSGGNLNLIYSAIPEPTGALATAVLLAGGLLLRRRTVAGFPRG